MRVLIIGGTRGIGHAAAIELRRRGHHIALAFRSHESQACLVAEQLGIDRSALIQGDIATDATRLVQQAAGAMGGIDHILVTAVPVITGRVATVTREQSTLAMNVVVDGFREVAMAARSELGRNRGSLIAVTSLGSDHYASYYGALGPAKAALEALVRYLAAELGVDGIRVNAVSPCLVNDPQHFDDAPDVAAFLDGVARRTPLGRRLAVPQDIARAAIALMGDHDLGFVTGQVLKADGGYSLLA